MVSFFCSDKRTIHEITRNSTTILLLRVISWIVFLPLKRQSLKIRQRPVTASIPGDIAQLMTLPVSFYLRSRSIPWALLLFVLMPASPACVKRSRVAISSNKPNEQAAQTTPKEANDPQPASIPKTNQIVNINTASANELETLPGIGKGLAERIIDHRERFGPFRRPEHLIIVRGISDRRFRAIRHLITVE